MKPLVVGLTGGAATGKSTVARLLGKLGAEVHDCDHIAHQALIPNTPTYRKIKEKFRGLDIWDRRRAIDRNKLGRVVFRDVRKRKDLEKIIHPFVYGEIKRLIKSAGRPIVIFEVPLLFETHFDRKVDHVIVVDCNRTKQISRLRRKFRLRRGEAERRLSAQWPMAPKKVKADFVVDNDGTLRETEWQVRKLWKQLNGLRKTGTVS